MEQQEIRDKLADLYQVHRDLDDSITALEKSVNVDLLQIQRLKKKKLSLKDHIMRLESMLLPDIIA